jgi:hypothetical protein
MVLATIVMKKLLERCRHSFPFVVVLVFEPFPVSSTLAWRLNWLAKHLDSGEETRYRIQRFRNGISWPGY